MFLFLYTDMSFKSIILQEKYNIVFKSNMIKTIGVDIILHRVKSRKIIDLPSSVFLICCVVYA